MKLQNLQFYLIQWCLWATLLFGNLSNLHAEGSKDFRDYPGYRLFFNAEQGQQLKVYAAAGETINLGTSHIGISGGFITVYRPDGTLYHVFNDLDGVGLINNDVEELAGPTGGGITNRNGYIPAVVNVAAGQSGIWTVKFEYPTYSQETFTNLMNNAPWNRFDQPVEQRVVLAWDITVSQGGAANMGGNMLEGRVYSNEYISIQNGNDIMTSPSFFILTKDGFQYRIDFKDTDPWGFPIFSNSVGLVRPDGSPCYQSAAQSDYNRSGKTRDWTIGNKYLYEPQAEDEGNLINNKIFFNPPDPNMPSTAMVTDIKTYNTHTTWLYREIIEVDPKFEQVAFVGIKQENSICTLDNVTGEGQGGYINFEVSTSGTAKISLDFNGNGVFEDAGDRTYFRRVEKGTNSITWDGKDGAGNVVSTAIDFRINYKLEMRGGEIHVMMLDVENNPGGISFTRLNGLESPSKEYFYDHSTIGGSISGDGITGNAKATVEPYTYSEKFGNNRLLDYWSYIEYSSSENGGFTIDIIADCSKPIQDFDRDLIPDFIDLDDDNDGVADFSEYCNPEGDFVCLPGGVDPSADADSDDIPNYIDSSDPAINNNCLDANEDGICDVLNAIYDTDGDGVPDHLDLDSDNDGITDLVEAGHLQKDIDGNGVIDGDASFFGKNGLFNAIASDPDDFSAFEIYNHFDVDRDGVPDYDDLDSDNDGINDVAEANFGFADSNNDGRIDDGNGNPPIVSYNGFAPILDPLTTGVTIPFPPDTDIDGVADWHDLDSDNDGINDVAESVKTDPDNDGIIGEGIPTIDINGRAIADQNDTPLTTSKPTNTDETGEADYRDLDADDDGINDVDEADQHDLDADGRVGTGIPLVNEQGQTTEDNEGNLIKVISNPEDTDKDLKPDFQDIDRDGDGILDSYECPDGWPCVNTDNDLLPDVDDLDSDDDLLLDKEECPGGAPCPTNETNAIDNFLTYTCNPRNTPTPAQPLGGGQFCEGSAIELNASGDSTFTEMIIYRWTGPNDFNFQEETTANTFFPVQLADTRPEASGTYELVLETTKGCKSEPLKIAVDLMEKPLAPALTVAKDKLCAGEPLELEVNTYSGDAVAYVWYKETDGVTIAVDTTAIATLLVEASQMIDAGIYTAIVNVNGCASSISNAEIVQVKTPIESPVATSSATILNPACEGETVQLGVPFQEGATYEWIGPNNFTSDRANPSIVDATFFDNGNYSATVTFGGCTIRTNEVAVMINARPTKPTLKMEDEKQCEGASATLRIIEPVSYPTSESLHFEWYTIGRSTPISTTVNPTLDLLNLQTENNGDYYVEVSLGGCVSTPSNVQTIEIQPSVTINASSSATTDNPGCEGDLVMLTGTLFANGTYEWYGPNGLITDQPSTGLRNATTEVNGTYSLVVTIDGCSSTSEPLTVKVNPKPTKPFIVLDNAAPCTGEDISIRITNTNGINMNNQVQVDWYNATTNEVIITTENLIWQIENLENIDEGEYYSVLTVDGCASENSNVQRIATQPGLTEVTILSNAEADVSPICEGEQVNLTVPFEAEVTYQWYGPNGLIDNTTNNLIIENASADLSGAYYLVREKAGCTRTSEAITIQVTKKPDAPQLEIIEGPQCFNGEVTFMINNPQEIPSGSEALYSWYHVQTNEQVGTSAHPIYTLTNLSEANNGTYYAVLTVDGCSTPPSNVGNIVVQAPTVDLIATASAGIDSPVCEGETVSLNVPFMIGATYEWFGPNGFTANVPNPSIPTITTEDAGSYYAVITTNVCPVLTNEVMLQVNTKPEIPNLTIDKTQQCEGETTQLVVTKPTVFPVGTAVIYEWFTTDSDVPLATTTEPTFNQTDLKAIDSGTLYALVTQNGCTSELSNTVDLEVTPIPNELAFIMDEIMNICDENELSIEAIQPMMGTGQWTTNGDLAIVDPLNPSTILLDVPEGVHTIYWTLSYKGCQNYAIDSLVVQQEAGLINAKDDDFTIELNQVLEAANVTDNDLINNVADLSINLMSEPANGVLFFENGQINYTPTTNFFGTDSFEYEVCNANCPDKCDVAKVQVKVVDSANSADCFAPNIITPNNDGMNDLLRIPCVESDPQSQLKVFNRWGDLVYETTTYRNDWGGTYNGNPLPNGTYFYLLQMGTKAESMQGYFTIVR